MIVKMTRSPCGMSSHDLILKNDLFPRCHTTDPGEDERAMTLYPTHRFPLHNVNEENTTSIVPVSARSGFLLSPWPFWMPSSAFSGANPPKIFQRPYLPRKTR